MCTCVHILLQNGALRDMGLVRCGICEIGQLWSQAFQWVSKKKVFKKANFKKKG